MPIGGYTLRDFPVFRRTDSLERMYNNYTIAMCTKSKEDQYRPITKNTFYKLIHCLTVNSTEVSACSYFYVDFLDLTDKVMQTCERAAVMIARLVGEMPATHDKLNHLVEYVKSHCELTKDFFKYKYEQELKIECDNGYRCTKHAVGGDCEVTTHNHEFSNRDGLVHAMNLGPSIESLVNQIHTALK